MRRKNKKKKCNYCGKELTGFFFNGKRIGIIAIYGGKDKRYCSEECYNKSKDGEVN